MDDAALRLECARMAVDLAKTVSAAAIAAGITDLDVKPVDLAQTIFAWVNGGHDAAPSAQLEPAR